jgi:hypothetical protein
MARDQPWRWPWLKTTWNLIPNSGRQISRATSIEIAMAIYSASRDEYPGRKVLLIDRSHRARAPVS